MRLLTIKSSHKIVKVAKIMAAKFFHFWINKKYLGPYNLTNIYKIGDEKHQENPYKILKKLVFSF